MLLETTLRDVQTSGIQEVARATIKTSPKIFNFFADQTYANKPRAICRELVANAFDSHVMAGKPDLPVEVWLPTILEPTFKVRDHGLGMAHSFMMNEFMCYADGSTKDSSNVAIGGFGIGSKSPFAYVDQYTVKSIFDGRESVYSIFKDEEGIPAIALLGQRVTTEPNGVEVSFPVKPEDFPTFEEAAFEALRYFEPLPDIRNALEGSFNPPQYVSRGKTWGMRSEAGPLQIIMGGVMYPVNVDNLTYKFPGDSPARKLLRYGLDLRVPIGTCSVALSREALSYDDDTIAAIQRVCEEVIEEVAASFSTMFDHIDSSWEACVALQKEVGGSSYYRSERANFLSEHAVWKGQPLTVELDWPMLVTQPSEFDKTKTWQRPGYEVLEIDSAANRYKRGRVAKIGPMKFSSPDGKHFAPHRFTHLVIDDLPQSPKSKTGRKLKEFAEEHGESVLVVRPSEWLGEKAPTTEQLIAAFDPDPSRITLTSELPEPIMERGYSRKMANRPKVRMFKYTGTSGSNRSSYGSSWRQPRLRISPEREYVEEIPYLEQPNEGVLVEMENFIPPEDLETKVNSGLIFWHELRFVNRADAKKLSKQNWTRYDVAFENRKKARLAAYPELAQRLAVSKISCFSRCYDFFRSNPSVDFTSRKPLGKIYRLYKQYVEPLDDDQRRLAQFVEAKLPRGVKPEELLENLKTKQRAAWRLMQLLPAHLDEEDLQLFQENL